MVLHFNVTGESRKAMVKAIEQMTGERAKYLGVPSCAYRIGNYTVGKTGNLNLKILMASTQPLRLLMLCNSNSVSRRMDKQYRSEKKARHRGGRRARQSVLRLPFQLEKVKVGNLTNILEAKGDLIKKALGIPDLGF